MHVGSFAILVIICVSFETTESLFASISPLNGPENKDPQAILRDNVDISMSQAPGGSPQVTSSSSTSNMLWHSSDNATALYLHTNSSPSAGWGGMLELKRPGGGGTLGIKQPSQGGRPVVTMTGSTTLYEKNGTSVGINGMVDSTGNRQGHMSIKRP